MFKFALCFALLLATTLSYAQAVTGTVGVEVENGTLSSGSNYARTQSFYQTYVGETIVLTDETIGSPYLNDAYQLGTIIKEGKSITNNVALRYNAYKDVIVGKMNMNDPEDKTQSVIKSEDYKVKIGADVFVAVNDKGGTEQTSYYQIIEEGDKADLLKRHTITYTEKITATTSMTRDVPPTFKHKEVYYLYDGKKLTELSTSRKKLTKALGMDEKAAKKYIKENKINLKKENGLKRIFKYYNTL